MVFDIRGKAALVTGGASGLGLHFAKALLSKGAKGVVLADLNASDGQKSAQVLNNEFGSNAAIFVKTDVTKYNEFEEAFKTTLETFGHIDILINNAGIGADGIWQKEVEINVVGTINGMILGMDKYLNKYKSSDEGVIIVTSSVCGVEGYPQWPVYSATKFAITGMVQAWGSQIHYDRTKIKVMAICPGPTNTNMLGAENKFLSSEYEATFKYLEDEIHKMQEPEHVAAELIKVLPDSKTGAIWIVESGEPIYEFILPKRDAFRNLKCN